MCKAVTISLRVYQRVVPTRARKFTVRRQRVKCASDVTKSQHSCRNSSGRSPSIQFRPLSLRLRNFWFPNKGSGGQTIHLGRRKTVRAELVHKAAPGILRDSHSPPCVVVEQVPQQPGSILMTYSVSVYMGIRYFHDIQKQVSSR